MSLDASGNTHKLRELFREAAFRYNLRGVLGVTRYDLVYDSLMPVQKSRLEAISGERHGEFMYTGFFVSIAYAYPDGVIDNIGNISDGGFDKDTWNIYAKWYETLNDSLNQTSKKLAEALNGIPLPATSEGLASEVRSVKEYYPTVVSHRIHAEHSGLGWRGKNSLLVNPIYSCMMRLAGVIASQPFHITSRLDENCGTCEGCLQVCPFLRHCDKLDDYREQCLSYMNWLDLDDEVCGKCIKACAYSSKFTSSVEALIDSGMGSVFYTHPNDE